MHRDPKAHGFGDNYALQEIEHRYGENVHILSDPFLFSTLAKLCRPETHQPEVTFLVRSLYSRLIQAVINREFPRARAEIKTRMAELHSEGNFEAEIVDPTTKAVCVSLARAGILPTQVCFEEVLTVLSPVGVRQDHISISRKTNDSHQVTGTEYGGIKIGGPVEGAMLLIPDPMGATGSTIASVMDLYRHNGKPLKAVAMHLIVTPESLKLLSQKWPDLIIYALRLDRGLSPAAVLETIPGTQWESERGLNATQYIVPGAGGLGEVINNAYV